MPGQLSGNRSTEGWVRPQTGASGLIHSNLESIDVCAGHEYNSRSYRLSRDFSCSHDGESVVRRPAGRRRRKPSPTFNQIIYIYIGTGQDYNFIAAKLAQLDGDGRKWSVIGVYGCPRNVI